MAAALHDLGDVIPLSIFITDDTGAAADAGAVVLTVTLPDGSVLTPAISHPVTGSYTYNFPTTQAGRHTLRWVATGANASAYADEFDVLPADPGLIIGLDFARGGLQIPAGQTLNDEDLRDLVAAARGPMEDICGPILKRNCDEWYDGGSYDIRLLWAPVVSVTAVVECLGSGSTRTLTEQPLDGGTFNAYGYTIDKDDGLLTRRTSGSATCFIGGRRNVHVTYVAGRAVIPEHIRRATRRLISWLYRTELQGQRPANQGPEKVSYTPSGFAVPKAVIELCGADARIPGMA